MGEPALELDDIQSGVLRPRPSPYAASYVLLRIDERSAGRQLLARLTEVVVPASRAQRPARDTWVSVALTFQGLRALGVADASLATFSPQFREGMAARAAAFLGDRGASSPARWE